MCRCILRYGFIRRTTLGTVVKEVVLLERNILTNRILNVLWIWTSGRACLRKSHCSHKRLRLVVKLVTRWTSQSARVVASARASEGCKRTPSWERPNYGLYMNKSRTVVGNDVAPRGVMECPNSHCYCFHFHMSDTHPLSRTGPLFGQATYTGCSPNLFIGSILN